MHQNLVCRLPTSTPYRPRSISSSLTSRMPRPLSDDRPGPPMPSPMPFGLDYRRQEIDEMRDVSARELGGHKG